MNTIMIISFILFHLPFAFYVDTRRKYKRMKYYNNPNSFNYDLNNDFAFNDELSSYKTKLLVIFCILSSYIGSLFPLFKLLNFHWIFILILNFFVLGPALWFFVSFLTIEKSILSFNILKPMSIVFIVLGIIFYLVGIFTF